VAYIFHESELPSLISEVPGRERIFFVNQELAKTDDMLAGVMHYKKGAASPYHLHKNCEHFYFFIDGKAQVETEQGIRLVGPGDMVFIPAEEKHRLRALEPLFISSGRRPIVSRQRFWKALMRICAGIARTARFGFRPDERTFRCH
jgi:mannose-6-phosphate isomerase-like protein (cupin superfamily)